MHLHAHVGQFRELTQKARKTLGNHVAVFVPVVEHITQQIHGGSLRLDAVEEAHEATLLCALMRDGERAQMGIGKEIDIFHLQKFQEFK